MRLASAGATVKCGRGGSADGEERAGLTTGSNARVRKMTPTELAAFLAHRSVLTVMKYYEMTSPARAAERFDVLRDQLADSSER